MKEIRRVFGGRCLESEETEVKKDIQWLKREIHKELEDWHGVEGGIDGDGINEIMLLINQLDEPETLSEDWIQEHSYNVHLLGTPDVTTVAVPREDLQNLLVPKQELPVIPKFVAEWIEGNKEYNSLRVAFECIAQQKKDNYDDELAFWVEEGNSETFARAWLDGFTVEEEPLYRARLKVITDEFIASYLRTQSSDAEDRLKALEIGSKYIHEDYRHLSEFTEDELKRLDIWDSKQWELEELEE